MMLPQAHKITNSPSFRESLAARDPVNKNAPGLVKNKNGPPGPEGNKKGRPIAVTSSEELSPTTSQTPLSETRVSSLEDPSPTPTFSIVPPATSPTLIATSSSTSSLALTSSSGILISVIPTLSTNFNTHSITTTPPIAPVTTTDVSASNDGFPTSAIYLVSSSVPSTPSTVLHPGQTTLWTSITYTSSTNTIQTGMNNYGPKSTASSGRKAGIVVGTLAGFAFILTLIFLLVKWRRSQPPKALPCPLRCLLGTHGSSRWLSRSQTPDAMSNPLLTAEAGLSGMPSWDYKATFALSTMPEKARLPLRKSQMRLFRFNPLGQNPITSQGTGARALSRKSFTSFFHRLSAASNPFSASYPSLLQSQPGSVINLEVHPLPCASFLHPQPSALPGQSREAAKSETDGSPRPRTMPPQVPPHVLRRPKHHRNSQMTMASEKSEARSFDSVSGWGKFHSLYGSDGGEKAPREPGKALPPLRISPSSWLKTKTLRRSRLTTAPEDEKRPHTTSENSDESTGIENAAFARSRSKKLQMGWRISSASANSLEAEKQMFWKI